MPADHASDFADFGAVTYLNCAFQGPMPTVATAAAEAALELKKTPFLIRDEDYFSYPDGYRSAVARLIGGSPENVAVTDSATHGLMLLVNGLDWREGDEVVLPAGEFPANRFPWLSLSSRGVRVREITLAEPADSTERLCAAVGPRTRVVAASWVSYSTGLRLDLAEIGEACRRHGALLAVDGTQGIGGLPYRLDEAPCDLLACAGYKWLLGPYGLGFAYVAPELGERLKCANVNWFAIEGARDFDRLSECDLEFSSGAARFDVNETASFTNVAAGTAALGYLADIGVDKVERHVQELLERLAEGLPGGFRETAPPSPAGRSNIFCFQGPTPEATGRAFDRLAAAGFFVSRREGSIRVSPHIYNAVDDVDRLLQTVATDGSAGRPRSSGFGLSVGPSVGGAPAREPTRRVLDGRHVMLRPVRPESDAARLYEPTHGTPANEALWTYMAYGPFSGEADMRAWLARSAAGSEPMFFTVAKPDDEPVGMAALQRFSAEHRSIEIAHLWYTPAAQRSAANTETVYLLLREAFERLGVRRVEWKCDALNRRSRVAARRLGFRFEGVFRQHFIVKGRSRDTAWFALLDSDWPSLRADLERWLASPGEVSLSRLSEERRRAAAGPPDPRG